MSQRSDDEDDDDNNGVVTRDRKRSGKGRVRGQGRNGTRNLAKDCRGTVLTTPNTR